MRTVRDLSSARSNEAVWSPTAHACPVSAGSGMLTPMLEIWPRGGIGRDELAKVLRRLQI